MTSDALPDCSVFIDNERCTEHPLHLNARGLVDCCCCVIDEHFAEGCDDQDCIDRWHPYWAQRRCQITRTDPS